MDTITFLLEAIITVLLYNGIFWVMTIILSWVRLPNYKGEEEITHSNKSIIFLMHLLTSLVFIPLYIILNP